MDLEMAKGEEIAATTALVADSAIKRIFIGGLSATVTTSDMETTFSPLGKIDNIEFVRSDGRSFAFMDLEPNSEKSLAKLFAVYNGCAWKGGKLRLERAKEHYLTRLKREWAEDASENVLDDLNAEKSSDHANKSEILAHKSKCQNLENVKLQIYFPKLRKVKPVPFKGTGKHKYSFQRVEVPPLPIHFCDCAEHCGPSEMANETYMTALNSAAYKKERSIMTSVMNKFLEKEGNKVPEPGMVNFSKEGIAVDTAGGDVQLNETDEAPEEDADNLVTNIGVGQSDDMLMQLLGKKSNVMDQVRESGIGKPQPSTDGHLRDKAHSRKRQTIASADTEVAPSQAAPSIPVETDNKFASVLPKSKTEAVLDEDFPSKMQTEHGTDSVVSAKTNTWIQKSTWRDLVGQTSGSTFSISTILPASKTLKANDSATKNTGAPKKRKMRSDIESSVNVEVKEAIVFEKTNLMDQVHELGIGKPQPSTDGHLRDTAHSRKRQLIALVDTSEVAPNQAAPSIPVETDDKFASVLPKSKTEAILDEDSPCKMHTEHGTDIVASAKTNTWIQKSSWRDLVGQSSGSTFSISTILPASKTLKANDSATKNTGASKKRKMQSDIESSVNDEVKEAIVFEKTAASTSLRAHGGDAAPGNHNVEENQSSHLGQKRSIPKISIGEVCTFMRSAQSEKEWSRAKAVLSGYIKKKGDESHEAKAKPHRR